ncbi:MAG: hypothetical protein HRU35_04695 [Rickettsiaceae bacterium]|nr:hypothetical protein [Rickettsiaceae bacterium]
MRTNLFSPILIILIITLFVKASTLFGRIQEQTVYSMDTNTSSILLDTAYAKSAEEPKKAKKEEKKVAKNKEEDKSTQDLKKNLAAGNNSKNKKKKTINNFTNSEILLLKELSKRRTKLDSDKKDLVAREQVLKATERKLDQKVKELKALQKQLEVLMQQYNKKEHDKILSLVKIYESMKSKDAAKIFNKLEMNVLLKVVSNMKEVKVAPIIASMDAARAQELSMELAKQKPIEY